MGGLAEKEILNGGARDRSNRRSSARQRKDTLGLLIVGHVEHLSVETHGPEPWITLERFDDPSRPCQLLLIWGECIVDRIHLPRVDRHLAGEPALAAESQIPPQSHQVEIIGPDGVNGLYTGCNSSRQTKRPRKLITPIVFAVWPAVGAGP